MATKNDMERVGLFQEMTYHTIGDKYVSQHQRDMSSSAYKGKQILSEATKSRAATRDGYFAEFERVFSGEGYSNRIGTMRRQRNSMSKKNIGGAWVPSSSTKSYSGVGSVYGTFGGVFEHFSGISRSAKAAKPLGKNILTNPAKLGTGYGYIDVTIGPYPEYKADKYNASRGILLKEANLHQQKSLGRGPFQSMAHCPEYFDENPYKVPDGVKTGTRNPPKVSSDFKPFIPSAPPKADGGMKDGCLSKWPEYKPSPYKPSMGNVRKVHVVNSTGKTYVPVPGPKSAPNRSIVEQNVLRSVNNMNYRSIQSVMNY